MRGFLGRRWTMLSVTGVLIAAAIVVGANLLVSRTVHDARLDLTADNLYTLSSGTRSILQDLDQPVRLRLYFSRGLAGEAPQIETHADRVEEMLERYSRLAGDELELRVIDPEPFSEEEDEAVEAGLRGVPVQQGSRLYFGLIAEGPGGREVIPFFSPSREGHLEYDITEAVYRAARSSEPVVGLLSGLPIQGTPRSEPWAIGSRLEEQYKIEPLRPDITRVPDDVDVVMIVHPGRLSDRARYALDQYVMRGGRMLVLVDPYAEFVANQSGQTMRMAMNTGVTSNLPELFESWGLSMDPNKVVGDIDAAQQVRTGRGPRASVVPYPVWMDLGPDHLAQDDVVTADLDTINIGSTGALERSGDGVMDFTPLIRTGPRGTRYDVKQVTDLADPMDLVDDYQPQQRYTLAARLRGKPETAFPEGVPPAQQGEDDSGKRDGGEAEDDGEQRDRPEPPEHLTGAQKAADIIVVGDTDMLSDAAWVRRSRGPGGPRRQATADNGDLVVNAIDQLSGSDALIRIRNRGRTSRPFTHLEEIREQAEERYRSTEQKLRQRLEETRQKIRDLQQQSGQGEDAGGLTTEQRKELEAFREERVEIREELREVQRKLRADIQRVEAWTKFVNIGLMPLLIVLAGGGYGLFRHFRRR